MKPSASANWHPSRESSRLHGVVVMVGPDLNALVNQYDPAQSLARPPDPKIFRARNSYTVDQTPAVPFGAI